MKHINHERILLLRAKNYLIKPPNIRFLNKKKINIRYKSNKNSSFLVPFYIIKMIALLCYDCYWNHLENLNEIFEDEEYDNEIDSYFTEKYIHFIKNIKEYNVWPYTETYLCTRISVFLLYFVKNNQEDLFEYYSENKDKYSNLFEGEDIIISYLQIIFDFLDEKDEMIDDIAIYNYSAKWVKVSEKNELEVIYLFNYNFE